MKLFTAIIKTCFFTFVSSVVTLLLLIIVSFDLLSNGFEDAGILLLINMSSLLLIPLIVVSHYLPIYYLNKAAFEELTVYSLFNRFTPYLLGTILLIGAFTLEGMLNDEKVSIVLTNYFISFIIGFYIFIRTLK